MLIIIADSGSTKTQWAVWDGSLWFEFYTSGFNPYFQSEQEIIQQLSKEVLPQLHRVSMEKEVRLFLLIIYDQFSFKIYSKRSCYSETPRYFCRGLAFTWVYESSSSSDICPDYGHEKRRLDFFKKNKGPILGLAFVFIG